MGICALGAEHTVNFNHGKARKDGKNRVDYTENNSLRPGSCTNPS